MAIAEIVMERICDLYLDGNSIRKIKEIVGVSEPTISRIIKAAGIKIRLDNYQKISIDVKEVNALYDAGESTYQLAIRYGCSDETIRKLIVQMRSESERNILSEEAKTKIGRKSKANWQNEEYRQAVADGKSDEYYAALSQNGKANYATTLGTWMSNKDNHKIIGRIVRDLWQNPEYRGKQEVYFQERGQRLTAASNEALRDPEKRRAWLDKLRQSNANRDRSGWISSSQKQLYYILEDSNIQFYEKGPNTRIGPFYITDCVIPLQQTMHKPLVIEVNGEYWHSLQYVMVKDKQKASYIRNNTDYDLLVLDELEFNNFQQIESKLGQFGLCLHKIEASVSDITIRIISETDAQMLYSIFHYTSTIRKGATTFGAYVGDKLVAAISYTYPLRSSSAERLGLGLKEMMEISRLARKTNFICPNFASWFIAKTSRKLSPSIKCLLSFSDQTYGHTGAVYKAANFQEDGQLDPDYSYVSVHGQYHKKTIWDRAKRMGMSEIEYAGKHGLMKVFGGPKTRWVLWRCSEQKI